MVAESTFELELARIAASHNRLQSSNMAAKYGEDIVLYFTVVFACTVQRLHKYLFDLTTLGELKNAFLWL